MSPEERKRCLDFTSRLLFETPGGQRFTQDSPILPSVWYAFALDPRSQQELIVTVSQKSATGRAALELRKMLHHLRTKRPRVGDVDPMPRRRARVSYIPGQIAAKLYFDEVMRVVLPLTPWWHDTYDLMKQLEVKHQDIEPADWTPFPQPDGRREEDLTDALMLMRQEIDPSVSRKRRRPNPARDRYISEMPPDLSWLVRIGGLIADCVSNGTQMLEDGGSPSLGLQLEFSSRRRRGIETTEELQERNLGLGATNELAFKVRSEIVRAFVHLYENWSVEGNYPTERVLWRVTKNRPVHLAVSKSALTVKADAARLLFDVSCRDITWAILDSGIDSTHPAFKLTSLDHEREVRKKLREGEPLTLDRLDSRVIKTLDFTHLRELLDFDVGFDANSPEARRREKRLRATIARRMTENAREDSGVRGPKGDVRKAVDEFLEGLRRRISEGKDIDWQDLEPAIELHNPPTPTNDHGTHVAGILAADWIEEAHGSSDLPLSVRDRRMQGVCPDINLIDVRVFREDGLTDEFELLAAIQYLRWMNSRAGTLQVQGANLSLSLLHEVRRFACGRTPICDECNEASAAGMVIVAAAGNRGYDMMDIDEVQASDSYKSVSITDPGNAAHVITVGATHRKRPHEYGVSYFSSRGPTGDGRLKPDLVAPGEKIKGPTPNGRAEYKDGTSMAAPHVSGVAAMLMARHTELIGQPERIKSTLCSTATDLGRERYFQGHGLVDALRALQAV